MDRVEITLKQLLNNQYCSKQKSHFIIGKRHTKLKNKPKSKTKIFTCMHIVLKNKE